MRAALFAWMLLASSTLFADEARLYNDLSPAPLRAGIGQRVADAVAEAAAAAHRPAPRRDARLDDAAVEVARAIAPGERPSNDQMIAALWRHGVIDPVPQVQYGTVPYLDAGPALVRLVRDALPRCWQLAPIDRIGVGTVPDGPDSLRFVVFLQRVAVELRPVARVLPAGGGAAITGRLLPPFQHPSIEVTAPNGKVSSLSGGSDATAFSARFECGSTPGRYQIEVNGEDRTGPTLLVNFPVYCGVAPPAPQGSPRRADDAQLSDAAQAEAVVVRLVNEDRAQHGLPPLQLDERLSAVARAHAADLDARDAFGHVTESSGGPADRVRRAGIPFAIVRENLVRAYSPGEAERSLMDSPGHRANILATDVTTLGVGAAATVKSPGAAPTLTVTELFVQPPPLAVARDEVERRLEQFRRDHHARPLDADARLSVVAERVAQALSEGQVELAQAPAEVERALGPMKARYRGLRAGAGATTDAAAVCMSLSQMLGDPHASRRGVGVRAGKHAGVDAYYVVIITAAAR